jgi:hypothetical protein
MRHLETSVSHKVFADADTYHGFVLPPTIFLNKRTALLLQKFIFFLTKTLVTIGLLLATLHLLPQFKY